MPADVLPPAQRPRNVLFASTSFPRDSSDWRGIFMRHITTALAARADLRLKLWAPPGEASARVERVTTPREDEWLASLMQRGGISHLLRSQPLAGPLSALRLLLLLRSAYRRVPAVDVYHVNWLQCALPLPRDGRPALLTVLGNDLRLLRLPLVRAALRRTMRGRAVAICPNADWMMAPLHRDFGDLATVRPIPFGIDERWFGLSRDTPARRPARWLAVTRLTADKLGPLLEWSEAAFRGQERELHLFGPMQEPVALPAWVHYHGPATPGDLAERWFPHATGLVTLSRHAEGRPQVMLEAMAAGLPIVASRMPAHEDIVSDGVTGALCSTPERYEQSLREFEDPHVNQRAGAAARIRVRSEFGTWDDCAARYSDVYDALLAGLPRG